MFYTLKKRNRTVIVGLFCFLSFMFFVSAQGVLACGGSGCAKTCKYKSGTSSCPMMKKAASESGEQGHKADATKAWSLEAFSKVERYTCPMHPEVKAERSGKCPDCGMKLVKADHYEVYECAHKECPKPCVFPKEGKCCGKDLQKKVMSKGEYYDFAQLQDEYFCPMHPEIISEKAGKCSECGMKLQMRTVEKPQEESAEMLSFACPMHPDEVSGKAGDCSKCGMKLKEKKRSE
jgi:hypothetical protein